MSVLVGVTGTNGKTSTASFIRQILTKAGRQAVAVTTLGVETVQGLTPLPHIPASAVATGHFLEEISGDGSTDMVVEATSEALARGDLDEVTFDVAALTSFGSDHLDTHQTINAYRLAKIRLFDLVKPSGSVVWPADIGLWPTVATGGREIWTARHAAHRFGVPFLDANLSIAMTVATAIGVNADVVASAIPDLVAPDGRMEHIATFNGGDVYIDYAHNASGLEAALMAARSLASGRVLVVFGCGGNRDTLKRAAMGAVAHRFADVVVVTDDNPRQEDPKSIRRAILDACPQGLEIGDRSEAVRSTLATLSIGDVMVVAGRGHETVSQRGSAAEALDDRQLVVAALAAPVG